MLPVDHAARLARVALAVDGLSVGDALGEQFFGPADEVKRRIAQRALPPGPWRTTDDTEMALAIAEVLERFGTIEQGELAQAFARWFARDPLRGYGGTARQILEELARGGSWRQLAPAAFDGAGSKGNGGAMRAAPVGAYFAGDLVRVVLEARRSAEVTHAHPDGQAGAIAVAVAAAWAVEHQGSRDGQALLTAVHAGTPPGPTREGLAGALALGPRLTAELVADKLGSGSSVISSDTVPFALWCAARHLGSFEECFWSTVSGLGDRDTTCAIACGVVALAVGREALPAAWLEAREVLKPASREP